MILSVSKKTLDLSWTVPNIDLLMGHIIRSRVVNGPHFVGRFRPGRQIFWV